MKSYKVAVIGMVHDHVWDELGHWRDRDNVDLVAAADVNEPLRARVATEFGAARTYSSWREMLDREEIDIVQAATENSAGADVVEACAERGIHVISEKPMAATLAQADRMLHAADKGRIKLLINWPTAWRPTFQEWHRRIAAGEIGAVNSLRYRSAHNGPKEIGCSEYFYSWLYDAEKNGAGALMDYCCYAADMAAALLGRPEQVMGLRGVFVKDYPVPDDNAVIVARYPHAFVIAEASWTQVVGYAEGANPVAYGTGGSLAIAGSRLILQVPGEAPREIVPPDLAAPHRHGPEYLIHCIENDLPVEGFCSPLVSRNAQEILEAGLKSADTGMTVTLPA